MQSGNREKYRDFVEYFYPHIFRTAWSILKHTQDAEDVTQEVFIQVQRALPSYRNQGLKTWITRITINRAIDERRKRMRVRSGECDDHTRIEDYQVSESEWTEHQVLIEERKRWIHKEIEELPQGYRDIIQSFYMEGKTYEQISKESGLEKKSVESKLYRARLWMKRHWKKEDFE